MTARGYRDLAIRSEAGCYWFESQTPQNRVGAPEYRESFQRGFVHTLLDASGERVLWTRPQADAEGSPRNAWVSDDGFVVLHSQGLFADALLVFDRDGNTSATVSVEPRTEPVSARRRRGRGQSIWGDPHIGCSRLGLHWLGASLSGFVSSERGPCFWIRPHWGRRLVIALERGQLLGDAELGAVLPALWARDREWAEARFARPASGRSGPDGQERTDLLTALLIAWEQRLDSARVIEAVRAMEANDHRGVFSDHSVCALGRQWGWRAPISRVVARRVIRRLGAEPRVDVVRFYGGQGELDIRPTASSSYQDVLDLPVGSSAEQVLARVGAPDWITREPGGGRPWTPGCELWEYDGEGESTRIVWSPPIPKQREMPQTLMRTERIEAQQDARARLRELDFAPPATAHMGA